MFDLEQVKTHFQKECTACGLCLKGCPIIPLTELQGVAPEKIMEEILDLFCQRGIGPLARTRIYSCLYCNTCIPACPKGLNPALAFALGKGILQEMGEPASQRASSVLKIIEQLIQTTLPAFREKAGGAEWLITEINDQTRHPSKTILFPSCFGLIQQEVLLTTVRILQKIDPALRVLGGFDYCCGELQLIAGQPEAAEDQFARMIEGLNALSPEKVVVFCPTCKMNFDRHHPQSSWTWTFVTDFVFDHLDKLGPLNEVRAAVTLHDPCHFVRGEEPGTESPRKILRAIPGIEILEMENRGEQAWCCGAYAINGNPGQQFRDLRLKQAQNTGAPILSLYCPGCQMALEPEGPKYALQVQSLLSLLGRSLGIG